MHRFFVDKNQISNSTLTIIGDDVNHISKVLRLKVNEIISVCDGKGTEYTCTIDTITKKEVLCNINNSFLSTTEAPIKITLFQGLPKSTKMDLIIQKCVELGIVQIYPIITERVVVKVNEKDISGKIERWNRISEEAAKQSNRGIVPKVHHPISFEQAINIMKDYDFNIIPYEKEDSTGIKKALSDKTDLKTVGILIGPEGGFEQNEVEICIQNKISPVTLGPRILRTETAGFTATAIIQYVLGDMGGVI